MNHIDKNGLRISFVFSGIGGEHQAVGLYLRHHFPSSLCPRILHTASFDILTMAGDYLRCTSTCPLFGTVLTSCLPVFALELVRVGLMGVSAISIEDLKRRVIDRQVVLSETAFCHRAQALVHICMGDVVVSGIPCVDCSTYGKHRGLAGPTGLVAIVWIKLIQIHAPKVIVIEEVKPFLKKCLPMREDMLGGMYSFSYVVMSPRLLNLPVSRPRLYCIAVRRDQCSLRHSLDTLRDGLPSVRPLSRFGHAYFFMKDTSTKLTPHLEKHLDGYVKMSGASPNVFDLTQTPDRRPRTLLEPLAIPVITRACRRYRTSRRRLLSGRESLIAQGWPLHKDLPN